MFDYDEKSFDGHGHLLGESRYSVNGTLVAAHGGVATPWNCRLLRAVQGCKSVAGTWMCRSDPCPVPPQAHPSRCPTDLFSLKKHELCQRKTLYYLFLFYLTLTMGLLHEAN
ncbi:MAG: hypothetical protein P8163_10575 [Candidatus Thiodiazotropha sp.]